MKALRGLLLWAALAGTPGPVAGSPAAFDREFQAVQDLFRSCRYAEMKAGLDRLAATATPEQQARILISRGDLAWALGELAAARLYYGEALSSGLLDARKKLRLHLGIGQLSVLEQRYAPAMVHFEEALMVADSDPERRLVYEWLQPQRLLAYAVTQAESGAYAQALETLQHVRTKQPDVLGLPALQALLDAAAAAGEPHAPGLFWDAVYGGDRRRELMPSYLPPTPLTRYRPRYPDLALRYGVSAGVTVELDVDERGSVRRVRLADPTAFEATIDELHAQSGLLRSKIQEIMLDLRDAAFSAARKSRFRPARLSCEAVESTVVYSLVFSIKP
jgi:tetratricopeptide (TPR) repeat protein